MKNFNKVMSVIFAIMSGLMILALIIVGIDEIYYSLPGGIDVPLCWSIAILSGTKLGTWITNEVSRIIKS